MPTRRSSTPPRRRIREESSNKGIVYIGGGVLIVIGLIIGGVMGQHNGSHKKHPLPTAARTNAPARVALTTTARPLAPAPPPHATHTPVPTPAPLKTPSSSPSPAETATVAPSASPVAVGLLSPHPKFSRFPVTQEMLLGDGGRMHPATPAPSAVSPATEARAAATSAVPHSSAQPLATATPKHKWHPHAHTATSPAAGEPGAAQIPVKRTPQKIAVLPEAPLPADTAAPQTRKAETLVRRYLGALKRGDEVTAYRALGGAPGDSGLSLSEEIFVDHSMHIDSVTSQPDATGDNVQVEIAAKHGLYVATYRVEKRDGKQIITSHDFFKP